MDSKERAEHERWMRGHAAYGERRWLRSVASWSLAVLAVVAVLALLDWLFLLAAADPVGMGQ